MNMYNSRWLDAEEMRFSVEITKKMAKASPLHMGVALSVGPGDVLRGRTHICKITIGYSIPKGLQQPLCSVEHSLELILSKNLIEIAKT